MSTAGHAQLRWRAFTENIHFPGMGGNSPLMKSERPAIQRIYYEKPVDRKISSLSLPAHGYFRFAAPGRAGACELSLNTNC